MYLKEERPDRVDWYLRYRRPKPDEDLCEQTWKHWLWTSGGAAMAIMVGNRHQRQVRGQRPMKLPSLLMWWLSEVRWWKYYHRKMTAGRPGEKRLQSSVAASPECQQLRCWCVGWIVSLQKPTPQSVSALFPTTRALTPVISWDEELLEQDGELTQND